eukprot:scaffold1275_cov401-Prasinococcus_capsulatus_cf.AAC.3
MSVGSSARPCSSGGLSIAMELSRAYPTSHAGRPRPLCRRPCSVREHAPFGAAGSVRVVSEWERAHQASLPPYALGGQGLSLEQRPQRRRTSSFRQRPRDEASPQGVTASFPHAMRAKPVPRRGLSSPHTRRRARVAANSTTTAASVTGALTRLAAAL